MHLLKINKKTGKQNAKYCSAPQPECRSKVVCRKLAQSVSQDNANLTVTGITEITYVAVFCKQTYKKEFSFCKVQLL